jgi:hypothetical protein
MHFDWHPPFMDGHVVLEKHMEVRSETSNSKENSVRVHYLPKGSTPISQADAKKIESSKVKRNAVT